MKLYKHKLKFILTPGKINPAPPLGSSLGQFKLNLIEFCNSLNKKTLNYNYLQIKLIIYINSNKNYIYEIKTPSVSSLIKQYTIDKNKLTKFLIYKIAKIKYIDLYPINFSAILNNIKGTAKSMKYIII